MPPREPVFLALAHLKGGTGATSCAVNLAAGLALHRRRVLLLDLDPVAAATFHLTESPPERGIAEALEGRPVADLVRETFVPGLSLLPGSSRLNGWDRKPERFRLDLSRALAGIPAGLDFVLLDLPPSAGAITFVPEGAEMSIPS